ncbi:hypothetical protein IFM89_005506 [Coptis chinensis]|uniref:Trichome birefringence-like C-terminal domain-containing protein n=1 Tax=Coptis chinensis TaxID=261450 RepID=A0A835GUU3_9MAGN|nr:hypothetical protein IFM89_005506 [Coptis chinensis]
MEYGVTILLYRTYFLVDLVREKVGVVLKLDSIKGGNAWMGMDMLIFNSCHWWTHQGRTPTMGLHAGGEQVAQRHESSDCILQGNDNLGEMGRGKDWNNPLKDCEGEMLPVSGSRYPVGLPPEAFVVNKVLAVTTKAMTVATGAFLDCLTHGISAYMPLFYSEEEE